MEPHVIALCGKISIMASCTGYGLDPQKWNKFLFLVEPTSTLRLILCNYVSFTIHKFLTSPTAV